MQYVIYVYKSWWVVIALRQWCKIRIKKKKLTGGQYLSGIREFYDLAQKRIVNDKKNITLHNLWLKGVTFLDQSQRKYVYFYVLYIFKFTLHTLFEIFTFKETKFEMFVRKYS